MTKSDTDDPRPSIAQGANISEIKKLASDAIPEMVKLRTERRDLNEAIGDIRKRLVDAGLHRQAISDAIRYYEAEAAEREGYDDSVAIMREAIGHPLAGDLFSEAGDAELGQQADRPQGAGKGKTNGEGAPAGA